MWVEQFAVLLGNRPVPTHSPLAILVCMSAPLLGFVISKVRKKILKMEQLVHGRPSFSVFIILVTGPLVVAPIYNCEFDSKFCYQLIVWFRSSVTGRAGWQDRF